MDHKAAIKRRDFLNWSTHGIGGAALSSMFLEDGFASQPINPHYAPNCLLYTSPSPRDRTRARMPSSA